MRPLVIGESFVFYSFIFSCHHFQLLSLDGHRAFYKGGVAYHLVATQAEVSRTRGGSSLPRVR
jgi:hypothetical protein